MTIKHIIIAAGLLAVAAFKPSATSGYKPGDAAADFKLLNVDSSMVSLSGYQGSPKGFIVVFTCNHCPFSIAYEDRIIALHNKYAAQGYPVVAVNPNDAEQYPSDSYPEMRKRAAEKAFPFVYLHDATQEVARTYGAERTPHVFVLQKQADGSMVVKFVGAIDNNSNDAAAADKKYVEDAVDALLAGKDPAVNFVKAVGCGVKWKKN